MKDTPTMRSSCNFCRSRKIRCSGQNICSACSERNIDCVYVREASKGRPPRGSIRKQSSRGTPQDNIDCGRSKTISAAFESSAVHSHISTTDATSTPSVSKLDNSESLGQSPRRMSVDSEDKNATLASELEEMFAEDFMNTGLTTKNEFQKSLKAFHCKISNDPTTTLNSLVGSGVDDLPRRTISYAQLLYTMTQGLVEMLSVRFSNLGCHQLNDSSARFYAVSLANDDTPSMFKSIVTENLSPLDEFDSHRTLQMIEVWFSVHPLSNIISKTLLLRNLKSNTHDPILLAVMLADASYVHEDDVTREKREMLFTWADSELRDRPVNGNGLSTVQMLMLLGWHELCLSRARRATCYLGYAGRIVTRLQAEIIQLPGTGNSQINGVDVAEVEAELVRNMYWLTFSITLWSFMQIDQPYPQLLPPTMPTKFPPVDMSSSALVKLDIASGNVSTLAKQSGMIHELWPLSHIASTTAHIYALLPRKDEVEENPQAENWQSQPIHQLRLLLNQNWSISTLCLKIRDVLVNAVRVLEVKVENASSKALVLTAYHTTIIHLLFPRLEAVEDRVIVSQELLAEVLASSNSLQELFAVVEQETDIEHPITKIRSSTFADVFMLGLDVCGRAIEYFYLRSQEGSVLEVENIHRRTVDLASMASDMHKIAKSEILLTAKNLRLVKKKLKKAKLLFRSARSPRGTAASTSSVDEVSTPFSQEIQLGGQIPDLFPFETSTQLPGIWSSVELYETSSISNDMFPRGENPAFNKKSWDEVTEMANHTNETSGALLDLQPNINNNLRSSPEMPTRAQGYAGLGTGQQVHMQPVQSLGEGLPNLGNVDVDMDFSDLGLFGLGDTWSASGTRPAGGSAP